RPSRFHVRWSQSAQTCTVTGDPSNAIRIVMTLGDPHAAHGWSAVRADSSLGSSRSIPPPLAEKETLPSRETRTRGISSVERSTDKTEELPCWRADRSEEDAMGVERRAKSVWTGTLTEGEGKVTGESSGLFTDLPVTWVS